MDQDIARLRRMIEEIRQIRERTCDPKSNQNPRYHALSSAVSSLDKAAKDMAARRYRCRVGVTIDVINLTMQKPNWRMASWSAS
jgi:hypothetical protein